MLDAIRIIAERRISEALRNGDFNIEGWKGRPLPLDDNRLIPEDLRMAYKILKNAGYLPPEIEIRKEIVHLEELIADSKDEYVKVKQMKKLNYLMAKLNTMRQGPINLEQEEQYYQKIVSRISVTK